jgi:hypothetical protein
MQPFDQLYRPTADADETLRPLLERLYRHLASRPADLSALREAIIGVLEFLTSPRGRTDANCRAVDCFLMQDEAWDGDELPQTFVDILADMSGALHDTVSAPSTAANFDSTPEQLLGRARLL